MISYHFVAPILFPRLEKTMREKNIDGEPREYFLSYNLHTGQTDQRVILTDGREFNFSGNNDPENVKKDTNGNFIFNRIKKNKPDAVTAAVYLNRQKKELKFFYFNSNNEQI